MTNQSFSGSWTPAVWANFNKDVQTEWNGGANGTVITGTQLINGQRDRFTLESTDVSIYRDFWPDVKTTFPGMSEQKAAKAFYDGSQVGMVAFDYFRIYPFARTDPGNWVINKAEGWITVFKLKYQVGNDAWFTLSGDKGRLRDTSAKDYGAIYVVDEVPSAEDSTLFGFIFDADGRIKGITPKSNPGQYLRKWRNAVLQPITLSRWDSSCAFFTTVVRSPTHDFVLRGEFDASKCCTSAAYGADVRQQLCDGRGLSLSTTASKNLCASFMADPSAGYCKANYTSANCIEYCNDGETNCDAVYQAACNPATNSTAVTDPNNVCGCFLPESTYAAIRQKIEAQIPGYVTSQPACFYPKCASSRLRTKQRKTTPCDPTQIVACFTEIKVENNGVVSGDVNIKQTPECGFKGTGTSAGTTPDPISPGSFDIMTLIQDNIMIVGVVAAVVIVVIMLAILLSPSKRKGKRRK